MLSKIPSLIKNRKPLHIFMLSVFAMAFYMLGLISPSYAASDIYLARGSKAAVNGFDTVAYFTEQRPVKGKPSFKSEWEGVNWLFSNEENKAKFDQNPEKYAPRYGGYCAFAVANQSKAPGDPFQWSVIDGKLYMNINKSIKKRWLANYQAFIVDADAHWSKVSSQ